MEDLKHRRRKAVSESTYRDWTSVLGLKSRRQKLTAAHKSGTTLAKTSSVASRDATNLRQTQSDSHSTMLVSVVSSIALEQAMTDDSSLAGYSSKNDPYLPASGGADGSLLLSDAEISRQINDPMQRFHDFLLPKYQKYKSQGVSAADFVQAAGTIAVSSCPGGPIIKTVSASSNAPTMDKTIDRSTCLLLQRSSDVRIQRLQPQKALFPFLLDPGPTTTP